MGRIFRFFKITAYLSGVMGGIMLFSAFNESPSVEMGLGEGIQKSLIQQLEKGQSLTNKLMNAVSGEPEDDLQRTQWFHQQVEEQKQEDYNANERRENSYIYHHNGKKWVFIQDKYYEYNPKNIYSVNGIRTFYEPPTSNKVPSHSVKKGNYQQVTSTKVVTEEQQNPVAQLPSNPMKIYTKTGMAQLKQNLNDIQVQMKNRNDELRALSQDH